MSVFHTVDGFVLYLGMFSSAVSCSVESGFVFLDEIDRHSLEKVRHR